MSNKKIITKNKKAFHEYNILEDYVAGLVLTGTEIKSIRANKVQLKDSYARIEKGELWIYKMHISPYEQGNRYNHEPERKRKLLLTKQEIRKLIGKTKETGVTLIPLELFITGGWAKLKIGIGKGKNIHDKRESLARKSAKRDMERAMKNRF